MDHWQRETRKHYEWERRKERLAEAGLAASLLVLYAVGIGGLAGVAILVARMVAGF